MLKSAMIRLTNVGAIKNNVVASVNASIPKVGSYFLTKLTNLNDFYTRILGLDEVKVYQNRVVALQEKLLEAQDRRREIGSNLAEIRAKSNRLQDEIHKVKRQENLQKFLDLMREETEILKMESEVVRTFQDCDQTERELFTAFTNAVRDSHEKQRAQLEYTKYFGIILSIFGSFLAFFYSTMKKSDLKHFIEETIDQGIKKYSLEFGKIEELQQKPEFVVEKNEEPSEEPKEIILSPIEQKTDVYRIICYSLIILIVLKSIANYITNQIITVESCC